LHFCKDINTGVHEVAKNSVNRIDRNLARRLKEARRETGLSTRAVVAKLPKRVSISHSTLASYESGATIPPIDALAALSDIYNRTLNWFTESRESLGVFRYRNLPSRVPVLEQRHYEALAGKWIDAYLSLDRFLKARSQRTYPAVPTGSLAPIELAEVVRTRYLNLDDSDPVQNVVGVLESFSVWALELRATFGIDGAAAKHGDQFVVWLNPDVANERLRMNAAHELAHMLYDDCKAELGWSDIAVEKKAYDFAGNLLLPISQLRDAFDGKSFLKLIQYKEKFGISLAAMIYMAERAKVINSTTSRWLWGEIVKRGWRSDEPGYVWRDRAISFEMMLECAIQTKQISWTDAERVTGIRESELRDRLISATNPERALNREETDDTPATIRIAYSTADMPEEKGRKK
jgi:Zn-dependent peptidase ImmA (M78 family)/transcriptional regulator with XRE-family HTH domain